MPAGNDEKNLIEFWSSAQRLSEEDREELQKCGQDDWKELAPSEKLYQAAASLGKKKKVLDYGCGTAWAGIIAVKSGCSDVTAADPAPGALETARFYAEAFHVEEQMTFLCEGLDWLKTVADGAYDGLICSNVLDVVPADTAEEIIGELARVVLPDASVIIGLNFYMSPERAAERGMNLEDGRLLYVNGVLRLCSRTDEEWEAFFSPYFTVDRLDHFAWLGEESETRRLFYLKKK